MEKRINIAELLKDCPQGMELDCALWDDVKFDEVEMGDSYPICIKVGEEYEHLTEFGHWDLNENAKCVIFPKGKTTWEGFVPPRKFKVGDIVVNASKKDSNAFIYAGENDKYYECYVGLVTGTNPELSTDKSVAWVSKKSGIRPATEEEKEKLFKAIKDNGYKWNAETKALEKLIEPKFKVGDRVKKNKDYIDGVVTNISDDGSYKVEYQGGGISYVSLAYQDEWELVPNKFDVSTLIPFESRVLVRDSDVGIWLPEFFGCLCDGNDYPYMIVGGTRWKYCIPFEGNEHLLDTTDDCDEYYKTWED